MNDEPYHPRRILVVDDDRDTCEALKDRLEAFGYDVIVRGDGASALATIRLESARSPVHLVLLDLNMPGIDGMEVLRALRGPGTGIPVVVMSAAPRQDSFAEALREGADDYLEKPILYEELHAKCRRAIEAGERRTWRR